MSSPGALRDGDAPLHIFLGYSACDGIAGGGVCIPLVLTLSGDLLGPCSYYFSLTSFEHLITWVSLLHIDVYQATPFEITSSLFQYGLLVHKCNVKLFTGFLFSLWVCVIVTDLTHTLKESVY